MNPGDLAVPLAFGFVGSLHCVQMCGPIVLAGSVVLGPQPARRRAAAQAAYNAGRITTYSLLGALAGTAGTGLNVIGHLAGVRNTAAIVAGALLIAGGVGALAGKRFGFPRSWGVPARTGRLLRSGTIGSRLGLGMALGLLPCGLVYAALLKAIESAGPWAGAATMAAFGAGTAAPLLAVGVFSATLGRRFGRHAAFVSGGAVLVTGLFIVWRGLRGPASCCH